MIVGMRTCLSIAEPRGNYMVFGGTVTITTQQYILSSVICIHIPNKIPHFFSKIDTRVGNIDIVNIFYMCRIPATLIRGPVCCKGLKC